MTAGISLLVPIYRCTTKMGNLVLGVTACAIVSPYLQGICSKNPSGCFKLKIVWLYIYMSEWVKSLSRVRLFATPWTVAYQAPSSMGFSRQEYWSGLPFSFSRGSSRPRDRTQVSRIPGRCFNLWATREAPRILEWVAKPSSGDFPNPGIKPRSPALQADSLPSEPPGKPQDNQTNITSGFYLQCSGIYSVDLTAANM